MSAALFRKIFVVLARSVGVFWVCAGLWVLANAFLYGDEHQLAAIAMGSFIMILGILFIVAKPPRH